MNFLYGKIPFNPAVLFIPIVPTQEPILDTIDAEVLDTVDEPLLDTGV